MTIGIKQFITQKCHPERSEGSVCTHLMYTDPSLLLRMTLCYLPIKKSHSPILFEEFHPFLQFCITLEKDIYPERWIKNTLRKNNLRNFNIIELVVFLFVKIGTLFLQANVYILLKHFQTGFTYWNPNLIEDNTSVFNHLNALLTNNIRTMHPNKIGCRQYTFYFLQ